MSGRGFSVAWRIIRTLATGVGLCWIAVDGAWYYMGFASGDADTDRFMAMAHNVTWLGLMLAVLLGMFAVLAGPGTEGAAALWRIIIKRCRGNDKPAS